MVYVDLRCGWRGGDGVGEGGWIAVTEKRGIGGFGIFKRDGIGLNGGLNNAIVIERTLEIGVGKGRM